MEILLDTHIALWCFFAPETMSKKAISVLTDKNNILFYSVVSMLEVAVKHRKHPQQMEPSGVEFMHYCEALGFHKLEIDDRHVCALETLEREEGSAKHEDPFDRILLAQAKGDGMMLLTHDALFKAYNEPYVFMV